MTIIVIESDTVEYCQIRLSVSQRQNEQDTDAELLLEWWWDRQVVANQYGLPGRAAKDWGPDTLEGNLSEETLMSHRNDQPKDTADHKFRDEYYYESKEFNLGDIEVPVLSVANWVCFSPLSMRS